MSTALPAARGYEMSKILNGPWISLLMFVIVAFLFAMTVWNCIYFNKIRTHSVSDPATAKRPITKREATTLLVINVIMSLLLAFIAAFFLWKVFLEESVRAHFVKIGDTVGVYSGNVKEYFAKRRKQPQASVYDRPPVVDMASSNGLSAAETAELSGLFEADPEMLYRTTEPGFFTTEDKMKRFRCFRKYDEITASNPFSSQKAAALPARFRAAERPSFYPLPPPSLQPPKLPAATSVIESRRQASDIVPLFETAA